MSHGINRHYESAPNPQHKKQLLNIHQLTTGLHRPEGSQLEQAQQEPASGACHVLRFFPAPSSARGRGCGIYLLEGLVGQMFSSDNRAEELPEEIFSQLCLVSF